MSDSNETQSSLLNKGHYWESFLNNNNKKSDSFVKDYLCNSRIYVQYAFRIKCIYFEEMMHYMCIVRENDSWPAVIILYIWSLLRKLMCDLDRSVRAHLLRVGGFLWENSEREVGLFLRLECGGYDDVLAGGQPEAWAHLPQVNEELRASAGRVRQEEIPLQMNTGLPHRLSTNTRRFNKLSTNTRRFNKLSTNIRR